jgi:hypothetical protein
VFKWYASQNSSTPFHTGNSYTTSALTADTTFYISVSGSNYCENTTGNRKTVTVTVYPVLTGGTIGASQTYCSGIMPAIYLGTTPALGGSGSSNYTYLWESSTDSIAWNSIGISTQTHTLDGTSVQKLLYRRVVIDAVCGTAYSDTIQITINPLPLVSIGMADLCVGLTTLLSPDTGGTWVSSNTNVATITNNRTVTAVSTGTATLTYTSTSTGCIKDIPVIVGEFPVVDEITGDKVVCVNKSINLSNTTAGGVWTTSNDNVTITDPNLNPVTITGATEGKSYITYTVGSGICQTKNTFQVKVIPNTPPFIWIGFQE